MKLIFFASLTLYSILFFFPCKAEIFQDPNICDTARTGCVKCSDASENSCLVCMEGLKIKQFQGIVTESHKMNSLGGSCVSGPSTYDKWIESIHSNKTIEQIEAINYAADAQIIINFYNQIFDESSVYATLETLERVEMASKIKSQLLKKLESQFMPITEKENATTLIYGFKSALETEYRLFHELGFVPEDLKEAVMEDLNLIAEALKEIKADFADDSYIAYQGLSVLNQIMKYYELEVLDYENLSSNIKKLLFSEPEEWSYAGAYFPNGEPSKVDSYVLELLEENDMTELFDEEDQNKTQLIVDAAIKNLIIQYSGFNPTIQSLSLNFDQFSFSYLLHSESSDATSLSTKQFNLTFPSNYFSEVKDFSNIDEEEWKIMIITLTYKHINPNGNNPEEKKSSVANIQGYQIHQEDNNEASKTNLEKIAVGKLLSLPDTLSLEIAFNMNSGTHSWECLEYDSEWKVLSNATNQDLAKITCKVDSYGIFSYQKIIIEDKGTWANIGMHCSWLWLSFVGLLCLMKIFLFDLFNKQQLEENEGLKEIKFTPFTISMPISLISAIGWGDIAYKGLFMLSYFAIICVGLAYNIQENSDDEKETWIDFYTAFRILIIAWISKYFFGSLRIIQNDCFHSPAPLSIVLIITYFVCMFFCQRELSPATNDRQEQWLLSLVTAVVMDLIIDFLLAIIIFILPFSIKKNLLIAMRLGGFVTFQKLEAYQLGYAPPEQTIYEMQG